MRPMLATPAKTEDLRVLAYPKLMSPKLDGIRALVLEVDGKPTVMSRKLLPIPNLHVQQTLGTWEHVGLDGELIVGSPMAKDCYRVTESAVMTIEGTPDVKLHVFDMFCQGPYVQRALLAKAIVRDHTKHLVWVPQQAVNSYDEVAQVESEYLSAGYEGGMLRCPHAPYKQGRSTLKQEWLVKVKRFTDSDALVIGVTELRRNENEAVLDELGYTKRSHANAGKVGAGMMGTLIVRCVDPTDPFYGVEFEVGTGFTAEQRANLWEGREYLPGKFVKYKYFPIGCKDKPRHPVFIGWRNQRDM